MPEAQAPQNMILWLRPCKDMNFKTKDLTNKDLTMKAKDLTFKAKV